MQDERESQYFEDFGDEPSPQPAKKKMSLAARIFIVLGILTGIAFLVCCGGVIYIFNSFEETEDPDKIRDWTADIVEIDIPENFTPAASVDTSNVLFEMRLTRYENDEKTVQIMISDAAMPNREVSHEHIQDQLQGQQQSNLRIKESKLRTIQAGDQEIDFQFETAENPESGKEFRQIRGTLTSKRGGVAFILIRAQDEAYDEEAMVEMLKTIRN